METWEYKVIEVTFKGIVPGENGGRTVGEVLNELGADRWEGWSVNTVHDSNGNERTRIYLKRTVIGSR